MDSMIVRLAGNEYYCFLDGFSGYFQIPIDPRDQEIDHLLVPTERQYGSLHGGLLGLWEFPLKIALRLEENVMQKYGVTHRLSTAYHPQTSGQVEVSNRGLKRILERTIGENRASWSDKLDDALWASHRLTKRPSVYSLQVVYGGMHLPSELVLKPIGP
ncbi:reverse transcriptase domain-containing protein [Tanacetum coccineum]|uniref:Reverse transcriptase domain-containing protein n=1 Tax=Tanacetum coccineum TaxID=301880 RepID=A0ABQ4WDQ3_9ASTR